MNGGHVAGLGSVRGIAALVVLLGHCALAYRLPHDWRIGLDSLLNQRAAVIVFFVLSGYVLTLSWLRSGHDRASLGNFYIRRMFRILPALWLATAAAWLLLVLLPPIPHPPAHWREWAADSDRAAGLREVVRAFAAIDNRLLPPTWTITIELAGSLALPLLAAILARGRGVATVAILALGALSLSTSEAHSRAAILAYMVEFAMGAALALYPARHGPVASRMAALAGVVLLFAARPLIWRLSTGDWQYIEYRINAPVPMLIEATGAALLISGLVGGTLHVRFLHWRPILSLGDWSYGIYLIHFVFLRLLIVLLPPMDPVTATLLLAIGTLALSLPASALIHRYVELPGIAWGRRMIASRAGNAKLTAL